MWTRDLLSRVAGKLQTETALYAIRIAVKVLAHNWPNQSPADDDLRAR